MNTDTQETHDPSEEHDAECYEEEDLGTYPDGTPRTLTDDQIAMFRHSEIQTLLRERRRAREADSSDGEIASPGIDPEATASVTREQVEVTNASCYYQVQWLSKHRMMVLKMRIQSRRRS